jgi:hypothetical protein
MQFSVHASGSGKRIQVIDRIAGGEALNQFVDADGVVSVNVGSSDGQSGSVDVNAQMRADGAWNVMKSDYAVAASETLDVEDV